MNRTSENSDRDDFWLVNPEESYTLGDVLQRARARILVARDAAIGMGMVQSDGLRQVLNDALDDLDNSIDALDAAEVLDWHPTSTDEIRLIEHPEEDEELEPAGGAR